MTNELKPCPFCGSNEITITKDTVDIGGFSYVECLECHATSSWIKGDNYDKWNTRRPAFDWKPIKELPKKVDKSFVRIVVVDARKNDDFELMRYGTSEQLRNFLMEQYTHYAILTPPKTNQNGY